MAALHEPTVALEEIYVHGETVLMLDAQNALVASRSHPGQWWPVTKGRCLCPAATHHGKCRHGDAVKVLNGEEVSEEEPLPTDEEYARIMHDLTAEEARDAVEDRAALVAEQRMGAPSSYAVQKEEW